MSDGEKGPGMTIRIPAPRVLAEAAAPSLDPRTAEVLRSLDRAKGTIARMEVPIASPSVANLALELRALREGLSQNTHDILEQILENQTKAQAPKAGKRR